MFKDLFSGPKVAQAIVAVLCAAAAASATAIPQLQLDAVPGVYVGGSDETIYATKSVFDLYAYFLPGGDNNGNGFDPVIGDTFDLSIAVVPKTTSSAGPGLITVNGDSINVTSSMTLGTPGLLPPHGIFETYFFEKPFTFNEANKAVPYNTADKPGTGPTLAAAGQDFMYFQKFEIDASKLLGGGIHFDLYVIDEGIAKAPFSHDAQYNTGGAPPAGVPEPGMLALLGIAFAGVAFARRRRVA